MDSSKKYEALSQKITVCNKCPLHLTRHLPLIGQGPLNAKIFFIGEAPGKKEDLENIPFVGPAGKIFDRLLDHIQLNRSDIYITNLLKCHPPQNHNPTLLEISSCRPYLLQQLKLIKPKIIITLGTFASKEMFSLWNLPFTKLSLLHGKRFSCQTTYGKMILIPLYHPAAASHNPSLVSVLENDFRSLDFLKAY